jgi:hypothetical protein
MALYWLVYSQGKYRTVLIVEDALLPGARLRADVATPGLDDHFVEGLELDDATAARIPATGRMMTSEQAAKIIGQIGWSKSQG